MDLFFLVQVKILAKRTSFDYVASNCYLNQKLALYYDEIV